MNFCLLEDDVDDSIKSTPTSLHYVMCNCELRHSGTMAAEEPPAKRARVQFGSGVEQETKAVEQANASAGSSGTTSNGGISEAVLAGIRAGNINIDDGAH